VNSYAKIQRGYSLPLDSGARITSETSKPVPIKPPTEYATERRCEPTIETTSARYVEQRPICGRCQHPADAVLGPQFYCAKHALEVQQGWLI
jgi:hypothetical protein